MFHTRAFEPLLTTLPDVRNAPAIAEVVQAALVAVDDIAIGKLTGKRLGDRRVSGDLTGLFRVGFDVPGAVGNPRFRIVFAVTDPDESLSSPVLRVIAIGPRVGHLVHQAAVRHMDDPTA